jgi:antitoxin ParD1/3/4
MSMPASYALGTRFESFVRKQVKSGRYNNASEVVRAGLRLLEDRENARQTAIEEIRTAVRAGIASGHTRTADDVFERLEAKYRRMSRRRA